MAEGYDLCTRERSSHLAAHWLTCWDHQGGSIRGFLNDGNVDYKSHHMVDSLAFGHCDYPYRNLGRLTKLRVRQTAKEVEVTVDDRSCFKSDKVTIAIERCIWNPSHKMIDQAPSRLLFRHLGCFRRDSRLVRSIQVCRHVVWVQRPSSGQRPKSQRPQSQGRQQQRRVNAATSPDPRAISAEQPVR